MKKILAVVVPLVLCWPLRGGEPGVSIKALTPYLDDQTFAVVRVNVAEVDIDAAVERLTELGLPAEQLNEFKKMASAIQKAIIDAGGKEGYAVWSMADRLGEPFLVVPVRDEEGAKALAAFLKENRAESTV